MSFKNTIQSALYKVGRSDPERDAWTPNSVVRQRGAAKLIGAAAASVVALILVHSGPSDSTLAQNSANYDAQNKALVVGEHLGSFSPPTTDVQRHAESVMATNHAPNVQP